MWELGRSVPFQTFSLHNCWAQKAKAPREALTTWLRFWDVSWWLRCAMCHCAWLEEQEPWVDQTENDPWLWTTSWSQAVFFLNDVSLSIQKSVTSHLNDFIFQQFSPALMLRYHNNLVRRLNFWVQWCLSHHRARALWEAGWWEQAPQSWFRSTFSPSVTMWLPAKELCGSNSLSSRVKWRQYLLLFRDSWG